MSSGVKMVAAAAAGGAAASVIYSKLSERSSVSGEASSNGKAPLRVMVSGAAGQIGYSLLPLIASGQALGEQQEIILHLLDIAPALGALGGVKMELEDGAYPLLKGVVVTAEAAEALADVDVAVFVGGFPRGPGMLRKDLIAKNCGIFSAQGKALEQVAKKSCKILVVANPANTNCLILKENAPSIPSENFTCLTRLDLNRAKFQIAQRALCKVQDVSNVAIWGNHSDTQFPDAFNAHVVRNSVKLSVSDAVDDNDWLENDFIKTVQQRGKAVIDARKLSSAMSAANAIKDHLRTWLVTGTKPGETTSMGVWSNGNPYGVQGGLIFSFPVHIENGAVSISNDYKVNSFAQNKIQITEKELLEEWTDAKAALASQK